MSTAKNFIIVLISLLSMNAIGQEIITFNQAQEAWKHMKDKDGYATYLKEFQWFNNHFKLDTRFNCYSIDDMQLNFMLIIRHYPGHKYAVFEQALSETKSPKMDCFRRSYVGVKTKIPPFQPFVIPMMMGEAN